MVKKLCAMLIAVMLATSLFGFSSRSVGVTESDVEVFVNNFDELDSIMNETLDFEVDGDIEDMSVSEIMKLIPSDINKKATKELNELGISGQNALEKVFAITYGVAYNYLESVIDLMRMFAEEDEDYAEELDAMLSVYEDSFSEEDYKAMEKYMDELFELTGWDSDDDYSDIDWSDYDYDYDYDYDDDYYEERDKYGNITLMETSYYSEKYEYTYYRDGTIKSIKCYYKSNDDFVE